LRRFPDLVPPEVTAAAPALLAARDRLEKAWGSGPRTLIHGDAHVGNMYFIDGTAGLLDWQVMQYGQGMRDVTYFLINSLPSELRRAEQKALIELYLETLSVFGAAAPSIEEAWQQYRLHAVYVWISAAFTAAAATLQSEAIVRAGLGRSCAALVDLESIAAVRQL
jgi:aminoglycoside phosphotransferase (APT) family kinase protein